MWGTRNFSRASHAVCRNNVGFYWGLLGQIVGGVWECDVSNKFCPLSSSLLSRKYHVCQFWSDSTELDVGFVKWCRCTLHYWHFWIFPRHRSFGGPKTLLALAHNPWCSNFFSGGLPTHSGWISVLNGVIHFSMEKMIVWSYCFLVGLC